MMMISLSLSLSLSLSRPLILGFTFVCLSQLLISNSSIYTYSLKKIHVVEDCLVLVYVVHYTNFLFFISLKPYNDTRRRKTSLVRREVSTSHIYLYVLFLFTTLFVVLQPEQLLYTKKEQK